MRIRHHTGRLALLMLVGLVTATACTLNTPQGVVEQPISGAPAVRLVSPLANATYLTNVGVNVQALVTNAGADIARIEIAVDDAIVSTIEQPNTAGARAFSVTYNGWSAPTPGTYSLYVTAFRADGTSSEPANATVTVVAASGVAEATADADDLGILLPTLTPVGGGGGLLPTLTPVGGGGGLLPTLTPVAASATTDDEDADQGGGATTDDEDADAAASAADDDESDAGEPATVRMIQGVNVRSGPGTNFNPPLGGLAAGTETEILARTPASDWFKIRYYNSDGWVFSGLVEVSGSLNSVPVEVGPPTPIPVTPTPVPPTAAPATAAPQSNANLVVGIVRLSPGDPACGVGFEVRVDVANLGSSDTTATGLLTVQDVHRESGTVTTSTQFPIPIIEDGVTRELGPVALRVDRYPGDEHQIVVIVNENGQIPETSSSDNRTALTYDLQESSDEDCDD